MLLIRCFLWLSSVLEHCADAIPPNYSFLFCQSSPSATHVCKHFIGSSSSAGSFALSFFCGAYLASQDAMWPDHWRWSAPLAARLDCWMTGFLEVLPDAARLLDQSPCDAHMRELQESTTPDAVCTCHKCTPVKPSLNTCHLFMSCHLLQRVENFCKLLRALTVVLADEEEKLAERKAPLLLCQQQAGVVYFDIGGSPLGCNPSLFLTSVQCRESSCVKNSSQNYPIAMKCTESD